MLDNLPEEPFNPHKIASIIITVLLVLISILNCLVIFFILPGIKWNEGLYIDNGSDVGTLANFSMQLSGVIILASILYLLRFRRNILNSIRKWLLIFLVISSITTLAIYFSYFLTSY